MESARGIAGADVLLDPDCGEQQRLPLFMSDHKSNGTRFCDVDALVLLDGRVKVIVEIEESDTKPTQVCGKFLTSALAAGFIHESRGDRLIPMDDAVLFVQVVDTDGLADRTQKRHQWDNIAASIRALLPIRGTKIGDYELVWGTMTDFAMTGTKALVLVTRVRSALTAI